MLQFMYSQGCVEVRAWDHMYKIVQKKILQVMAHNCKVIKEFESRIQCSIEAAACGNIIY